MKILLIVLILVVAAFGAYYFMGRSPALPSPTMELATISPGISESPTASPAISSTATPKAAKTPTPTTLRQSINISGFAFSPATITVKKGTIVTWTNRDTVPHTITGDNGGPDSGTLNPGKTYSYTFNTVGTFSYHCSIHPNMTATVQVTN